MNDIKYHQQQEGWTHEYSPDGVCIYFKRPEEIGGGFVTVDFQRRIFDTGCTKPRRHAGALATPKQYTGHGWRDKLIADAMDYLESVVSK